MATALEVGEELTIGDVTYRVTEHPAAPGLPYGQQGRAATVYQLAVVSTTGPTEYRALKVFKPRYRLPALVTLADRMAAFADLDGLDRASQRGGRCLHGPNGHLLDQLASELPLERCGGPAHHHWAALNLMPSARPALPDSLDQVSTGCRDVAVPGRLAAPVPRPASVW